MEDHKGWYHRDIPHFDAGNYTQFITFRLADSLPQSILMQVAEELKKEREHLPEERIKKLEYYLDQGIGSCILKDPACAGIVEDSLKFLDRRSYSLISWVVMPNHVHLMARFDEGQSLSKAMHSLKSFTAHELKKLHPEMETIWQAESFDRYIRSEDHYLGRVQYIHENPVVAGLCERPEDFRWSSAWRDKGVA